MKTLREYVVTLDSMGRNLRNTLLHLTGCKYPTKGTQPGTTIWWNDYDDAIRYNKIGSKEKQFSPEPGCLETWLGTLVCKGFSHVSLRGDWMERWTQRLEIGPWLAPLCARCGFESFDWRLYRSATQRWQDAVDVRFDSGIPIEGHLDARYREYPEWREPVFGRPSKLKILRAAAEKRRAEKAAAAN